MKNVLIFGILIVAIAAVGVGTLTTVLHNIVQDADAVPDTAGPHKKVPGQFPTGQTQGGQQGPPPPGQRGN